MQPAQPDHHLWVIATNGEEWLHLPDASSQRDLDYDGPDPRQEYTAQCGAKGEGSLYAGHEFVLDEDWCQECARAVEDQRAIIAELKTMDVMDALKGLATDVPTFIVPSTRPTSQSKDQIFDPR